MGIRLAVGQSGGPTAVVNASLAGVVQEAARHPAVARVIGLRHGIEGALAGDVVDLSCASPRKVHRLSATPAAALGSCRRRLGESDCGRILDYFRAYDVHGFCYIGGNDSMDTCLRLAAAAAQAGYDLRVAGVPKTIDNDLEGTDHSPGYGSIARYWAVVTQEAALDLSAMSSYDQVLVMESMGRNAGWIAAAAALGQRAGCPAPQVLLVPERPFEADGFVARVEEAYQRTGWAVVVTAETIRYADGSYVGGGQARSDGFGHALVVGTADSLARLVTERLGVKARANRPGTLQRVSSRHASPVDRAEAFAAGQWALRWLAGGHTGFMVSLQREPGPGYRCGYGRVPLSTVANRERRLPPEFLTEDGYGVSDAFLAYARPLLGRRLTLPRPFSFDAVAP